MKRLVHAAPALMVLCMLAGCTNSSHDIINAPANTRRASEMTQDLLDAWYPAVVDTLHGGFLSTFEADWTPAGDQDKFIVSQARHVWTTARASQLGINNDEDYLGMAYQGYRFLRDAMYDHVHGGFRSLVARDGEPIARPGEFVEDKTAYGNAFGLYALAAYFEASGDSTVLEFAAEAFHWLDDHAYDPVYGGYYQFFDDEGVPARQGRGRHPAKDQNSSIHLLEAFTELYRAWPDPLLRERLHEMLVIVRDTIAGETGYLRLFFEEDWTPISFRDSSEAAIRANLGLDHVSFGHDIETAYLMMEAAELLGVEQEGTLEKGKVMVDHALDYGWDHELAGFHDGAYYFNAQGPPEIVREEKTWWVQAEGLNALLLMSEHFPDDPRDYGSLLEEQLDYIDRYLVDHENGGWYWAGLDRSPERKNADKASIWKAAYHDGRAMMNLLKHSRGH